MRLSGSFNTPMENRRENERETGRERDRERERERERENERSRETESDRGPVRAGKPLDLPGFRRHDT